MEEYRSRLKFQAKQGRAKESKKVITPKLYYII